MATQFDNGIFSIEGLAGEILPGAKLYWYASGTSTPLATYADSDLTTPNANPVVADAGGRFPPIWLQHANYKFVLKTALDVTLVTRDPATATDDTINISGDATIGGDLNVGGTLSVAGPAVLEGPLYVGGPLTAGSVTSAGTGLFVSPNSGTAGAVLIKDAAGDPDAAYVQFLSNDGSGQYGFVHGLKNGGVAFGGATEFGRFTASGNFGIGLTTPGYKLDVMGAGAFTSPNSGTSGGAVIRDAGGSPGNAVLQFISNDGSAEYAFLAARSSMGGPVLGGGPSKPDTDATRALGAPSFRWSTVYASTGTINTSDEREKTWRGALTDAELRAAKRIVAELGFYQWNDAIAEKGADGARYHCGVRAQRAFAILTDEGLDWHRYGWCCFDEWDAAPAILDKDGAVVVPAREAGGRYGIRPDELTMFLVAAQEARIAALEAHP